MNLRIPFSTQFKFACVDLSLISSLSLASAASPRRTDGRATASIFRCPKIPMDPLAAMEAAGRGQVCVCAETVEASTGNNVAAGRMEDERAGGGRGKRGHFLVCGYKRTEGHLGSPRCSNSWLVRTQNSRSLHKSIMKCLVSGRKNLIFEC